MDTRCGGLDVNEKLNEIMRGDGDNLVQNSTDYTTTVADADYALSSWSRGKVSWPLITIALLCYCSPKLVDRSGWNDMRSRPAGLRGNLDEGVVRAPT